MAIWDTSFKMRGALPFPSSGTQNLEGMYGIALFTQRVKATRPGWLSGKLVEAHVPDDFMEPLCI